jgi:drug/metabolite transporter (DMT)-like permease
LVWLLLALLSSAIYGIVAVTDKRLIDRYMPNLSSYYLWIGIAVFIYGIVFLLAEGIPNNAPASHLLVAGLSGLFWGGAMVMMFWGYKLQEVSRASAVVFTFPVFVALMATAFLDESLVPIQWAAIVMVVAGAILISLTGSAGKGRAQLTRAFPILLGASLLTASGHVTGKFALQELSVPLVSSFRFFGMAAVLAFFWRPQTLTHLRQTMRSREALALLLVSEVLLVPVAIVLMITATKLGPVSLVATITGTRPIFILLYSTVLSLPSLRILNESLDSGAIVIKLASVMMIIGGIVSLSLFVENRLRCFCPY